jgi:hypothetical protein
VRCKYLILCWLLYGCESVQKDRRISSIDAATAQERQVDSVINSWSNIDGFLDSSVQGQFKAYLTYSDSIAGKLMIVNKQEEDPLIDDSSIYYFSSLGEVIGYELKGDEKYDLHYFLLFNKACVVSVRKKDVYQSYSLDELSSCSKMAIAHREVSSVMQFFPSVHYKNLELPACTLPTLSTRAKASLLSEPGPGGRIIKRLNTDENLVYLGSQVGAVIDTTVWRLWYEVKTKDGMEGWIWGAPQIVREFEG